MYTHTVDPLYLSFATRIIIEGIVNNALNLAPNKKCIHKIAQWLSVLYGYAIFGYHIEM